MKEELPAYKAHIAQIRSLTGRLDEDRKDTFGLQVWWSESQAALPAWSSTLRAVLCHAPNSAPPERTFGIPNGSIGDGQYNAKADHKKELMQLQYSNRGRHKKYMNTASKLGPTHTNGPRDVPRCGL
jgi:hypothetical protein